jgi:hypothetical protein
MDVNFGLSLKGFCEAVLCVPSIIIISSIMEKIPYPTLSGSRDDDTVRHNCILLKTPDTFTFLPSLQPWVQGWMKLGCVHGVKC